MRYGYWLPVFGGWLSNVEDEGMEASWDYVSRLARRSEQIGYDLTLVAELNLNDIKGVEAPSLDAWSTAAALAAVTERLELMVAVRPTFHHPALLAKQAANIDHIGGGGRLSLNVVSSWWAAEASMYGVHFEQHDDRYARTAEWLEVVDGAWKEDHFSYEGKFYKVADTVLEPKPLTQPRPVIYAGGESEAAKALIAARCDAYVMHGDPPERMREKVRDMSARRERMGLGPMIFGVAGYTVVRDTDAEARTSWSASRTCISRPRATTTISSGSRGRSSSSACRSKTTRSRTAACARGWWGRPSRSPRGWRSSRRRASICSCFSAARSSRRWSASPRRSLSGATRRSPPTSERHRRKEF